MNVIRLNSIFSVDGNYTQDPFNINNLTQVDPDLGTNFNFESLMVESDLAGMKVVLDLPLNAAIELIEEQLNSTEPTVEMIAKKLEEALHYWLKAKVFGFYITDIIYDRDVVFRKRIFNSLRNVLDYHTVGEEHRILVCPSFVDNHTELYELPDYLTSNVSLPL